MSLVALQNRLKVLLSAEPLLAGRTVLVEEKDNLTSVLETALETQSLCVVIAPASGAARGDQPKATASSDETLEVVIHRGLLDGEDVPSTVQMLDALVPRIHGKPLSATVSGPAATPAPSFKFLRHEIRENGDGTYVRAIQFSAANNW